MGDSGSGNETSFAEEQKKTSKIGLDNCACKNMCILLSIISAGYVVWCSLLIFSMKKLGIRFDKFSRHYNMARSSQMSIGPRSGMGGYGETGGLVTRSLDPDTGIGHGTQDASGEKGSTRFFLLSGGGRSNQLSNSLAPFTTVGKPTCGVFFSRQTDQRKHKFGIAPTNLVKWRSAGPVPMPTGRVS